MTNNHADHCQPSAKASYKLSGKVIFWAIAALGVFVAAKILGLNELSESYTSYLQLIWWAVLLGLGLGGLIDYFVPEGFIFKFLGQKRPLTLIYAVVAGFIMSACSHGILALAIQLYKKGASIPATITFLMASPWANLPVTILLFGFFGAKAFLFIGAAMVIALITGAIFTVLEKFNLIEQSKKRVKVESYQWQNIKNFDLKKSWEGVITGSVNLANMVLWWIIIGFLAAVFIRAYVPAHIFTDWLTPGMGGILITLAVATVIEICSEGSAPLAFEIFNKTGSMGNPFVFLMAGVATDYTEIGLIWTNIGKRTAIWLPIVAVPQIVLVGILFNTYL